MPINLRSKKMRVRFPVRVAAMAIAGAAALFGAEAARAEGAGLSLTGRVGSPGFGLELSKSVTPRANLRCGLNFLGYGRDLDADLAAGSVAAPIHFDGELRLKTVGLLADLYASKGFHLTGGVIYNRSTIRVDARPVAPIVINDQSYTPDEIGTLTGTAKLGRQWAPYAGIGFGNPGTSAGRVSFVFDLGVIFQGQPHLTLAASGAAAAGRDADIDAAAELVNSDHFDKSYLKYYPVVSFGIGVRLF